MCSSALFSKIAELALNFRAVIEATDTNLRPIGLQDFPYGSCGDTCLLLGAYFNDMGVFGFQYVCGTRGSHQDNSWTSHAWLTRGKLIVDITADQFHDTNEEVIVSLNSTLHNTFEVEEISASDYREWHGNGLQELNAFYQILRNAI